MNKTILLCITVIFALLLCSCGGKDNNTSLPDITDASSSSDISQTPSDEENTPSTDNSSAESSESSDTSQGDTPSPMPIVPDSTSDQAPAFNGSFADVLDLSLTEKDAVSYRTAYTKQNPTQAQLCVTNPMVAITAVYDGSTTRFFDAVTGEYYTILVGKYCTVAQNGFTSANGKGGLCFTRAEGSSIPVWEELKQPQIVLQPVIFWSDEYKMPYTVMENNGVADYYCFTENSFVPCISNGKYGVVRNGKAVIPFEYDYIQSYQGCNDYADNGKTGVFLAQKDGKTYYISTNGNLLTPNGYTCGSQPYGNRAWVFDGENGFVLEFN